MSDIILFIRCSVMWLTEPSLNIDAIINYLLNPRLTSFAFYLKMCLCTNYWIAYCALLKGYLLYFLRYLQYCLKLKTQTRHLCSCKRKCFGVKKLERRKNIFVIIKLLFEGKDQKENSFISSYLSGFSFL